MENSLNLILSLVKQKVDFVTPCLYVSILSEQLPEEEMTADEIVNTLLERDKVEKQ
jgi:hypothetical protein